MAVIRDITEFIINEKNLILAEAERAKEQGKAQQAAEFLHDIGNAIFSGSTFSQGLMKDQHWEEIPSIEKLIGLFTSSKEEIEGIWGKEKSDALFHFLKELKNSLIQKKENLHKSHSGIHSCISHIEDILAVQRNFARDGSGIQQEKIHLPELLKECIPIIQPYFKKRNLKLNNNINTRTPSFSANKTSILQVLINTLKNAAESYDKPDQLSNPLNPNINIESSTEENNLIVTIIDHGSGIDSSTLERINSKNITTKSTGSGLGLSNCRNTLKVIGGKYTLYSEGKKQGSRVEIIIPLGKRNEQ